ncbi:recombinase family protein [Antarctobacter heliothermus]|uniref:recombinase family protein n=1 Tax=Antarctobacter heliothermus TaxID=74033 RepID=UPI0018E01FB4|nr:recombinase family protein [Antarctobacter heliothermus]
MSSQKQGDGVSLDAQKDAITEFASRENLTIIKWFEEKETAAKAGRTVFGQMMRELKRGGAAGLIIHRIDRSARNFRDWGAIGELSDAGVDVHFATESLDFRSRGGRLVADIQMAVAAGYCRNLSIEARKGINGRLKQGFYPFNAPIGYLNQGGGQLKSLDPVRAPLIKQLFELYLTGEHSIRSLHQEMVARGFTSRGGKPISRRTVENILQNQFYCGLTQNGRTGEIFQGKHEPLISVADFERVDAIKQGRYTKKKTKHDHLLPKLFACAACETVLTPERQKGRVYYRCHTAGCVGKTVREEQLEIAIVAQLSQLQFSDEDIATLRRQYETWNVPVKLQAERKHLELQLADVKDRQARLTDYLLDGTLDRDAYTEKKQALQIEIARLEEEYRNLDNKKLSTVDVEKFFELMKSLAGLYISAKPPIKRGIVENCFSNRVWTGENVELEPSDRLIRARTDVLAPCGGGTRDTFRTFIQLFDSCGNCNALDG